MTACFFGDGAVVEGEFHESMNLAELWGLPVLFLCENNLYAMGTAMSGFAFGPDVAARAASYGIESAAVDGMDVVAVEAATRQAAERVRSGDGPGFAGAADVSLPGSLHCRPGAVPREGGGGGLEAA